MEASTAVRRDNKASKYGIYYYTISRVIELHSIVKLLGSNLRLWASGCLRQFMNSCMAIQNHMTIYDVNHIARLYGLRMAIWYIVRKLGRYE